MADVQISVRRGGQEIDRIEGPLRDTAHGPAVKFRQRLWPFVNGTIDLDGPEVHGAENQPQTPPASSPNVDGAGQIADAPAETRMLVDAGPGTGKTYAACLRTARLIESGVPASRIWIVSFTRTAVAELRQRLHGALGPQAASVKIATLDAHAWAITSGFDAEAKLSGRYEDGIATTVDSIRTNEDVRDYLERTAHLIVDEAQDVVGVRADLVLALIDAIPPEAGVTVFADPAQAIYGFAEDEAESDCDSALLDELRRRGFERATLTQVHRTDCPRLREIFTTVRRRVLSRTPADRRIAQLQEDLSRLAPGELPPPSKFLTTRSGDFDLAMMRRRVEVLEASSWGSDVPHRLRMSGLPISVRPWVGLIFQDQTDRHLSRSRFDALWADRVGGEGVEQAWMAAQAAAGDAGGAIELHRLRRTLSRSAAPLPFCLPEFGETGPILGTIHASKGREADRVALYLNDDKTRATDEEVRVVFVGATRARRALVVGSAPTLQCRSANGRAWRTRSGKIWVELGRDGDLDCEGMVGTRVFANAADAEAAQRALVEHPRRSDLLAVAKPDLDWRFSLQTPGGQRLALLSGAVVADIRHIANSAGIWPPPGFFHHLRSFGLRTIAVAPDDPVLERLHEPWRSSGFLLAPLLSGWSSCKMNGTK